MHAKFIRNNRFRLLLLATLALVSSMLWVKPVRAADTDDFVISVKTDNSGTSGDAQFTIPTYPGETYDYNVDCNDDGSDEATGVTGEYICDYSGLGGIGTYTVRIKDNAGDGTGFPRIYFNNGGDKDKLLTIEQWGTGQWTSMAYAFHGCINLDGTASDIPDLSGVTEMMAMFANATSFNGDLSNWDVSHVTNMFSLFHDAAAFNQDIGGWDTSNVTTMSGMFRYTDNFNQDISGWDTGNVTTMNSMFNEAGSFNQDIGGWDTSSVTNMFMMFADASSFNQNLGGWDVGALTNAISMLINTSLSTVNYDALLIGWEAQNLYPGVNFGASSTYCQAEDARQNMINSDGWSITDNGKDCTILNDFVITVKTDNTGPSNDSQFMIPTFASNSYDYDVDCENDGVYEITGAEGDKSCDYAAPGTYTIRIKDNLGHGDGFPRIYFNDSGDKLKLLSVEQWGTGQWVSMANAFRGCSNLDGTASDIPDLSNVTDMSYMFADASSFNGDLSGWDVSRVMTMSQMFMGASAFNSDISSWDTSRVTLMNWMFLNATSFNQDIGGWNTRRVTDMNWMFAGASSFNQDIGGWGTGSVTSMNWMFSSAFSFNQDLSHWDTSSVTTMRGMFYYATSFDQPIGAWAVGSVTDMSAMFAYAGSFNQDLSEWDMSSVTSMNSMFRYADSFNQPLGGWATSSLTSANSMFMGASAFDQDLSGWDVSGLSGAADMFSGAALSTENYDALLIGWDAQVLQSRVTFDGGNSAYCSGEAARQNMIDNDSWTITDGGKGCGGLALFIPLVIR